MADELDIFVVLDHLDQNEMGLHQALSNEPELYTDLKKMINWLLPLFMSGSTNDADHKKLLLKFNEHCNPVWNHLYYHPELQMKLLAAIGLGKSTRHKLHKPNNRKTNKHLIRNLLKNFFPDVKLEECIFWCRLNSEEDLIEMINQAGIQEDDHEEILKAYNELRKT